MRKLTQFRTLCCSNSVTSLIVVGTILASYGCSQSPEKRPSPLKADSTQIGINKIHIQYSSPSIRGRKIFGTGEEFLEQYGKVWRTGANDATVFTNNVDIKIDTFLLPRGKYALFTIPDNDSWEIIFNKEWDQWGSYYHKDSLNILRVKVDVETFDSNQEQMKFYFEDESLKFRWANLGWTLPINLVL